MWRPEDYRLWMEAVLAGCVAGPGVVWVSHLGPTPVRCGLEGMGGWGARQHGCFCLNAGAASAFRLSPGVYLNLVHPASAAAPLRAHPSHALSVVAICTSQKVCGRQACFLPGAHRPERPLHSSRCPHTSQPFSHHRQAKEVDPRSLNLKKSTVGPHTPQSAHLPL